MIEPHRFKYGRPGRPAPTAECVLCHVLNRDHPDGPLLRRPARQLPDTPASAPPLEPARPRFREPGDEPEDDDLQRLEDALDLEDVDDPESEPAAPPLPALPAAPPMPAAPPRDRPPVVNRDPVRLEVKPVEPAVSVPVAASSVASLSIENQLIALFRQAEPAVVASAIERCRDVEWRRGVVGALDDATFEAWRARLTLDDIEDVIERSGDEWRARLTLDDIEYVIEHSTADALAAMGLIRSSVQDDANQAIRLIARLAARAGVEPVTVQAELSCQGLEEAASVVQRGVTQRTTRDRNGRLFSANERVTES